VPLRRRLPAPRSGRPHHRRCPRPLRASPPRPCGVVGAPAPPGAAGARLLLGASRFQPTAGTRQAETRQPATHRCLRVRTRRRSDTPPPSTRGRPRAGAGAGASCDRYRSHCDHHRLTNHADGRKPRWGDTRLPAAFARMGTAVRSSVRSSAGVPGNTPMNGGSDFHRRSLSPSPTDGPKRDMRRGKLSSLASIRSRNRARAR
jgi:hypothetical protein